MVSVHGTLIDPFPSLPGQVQSSAQATVIGSV